MRTHVHWVNAARKDPAAVAADPDAPPEVLLLLANDLPDVVATNPSWWLTFAGGGDWFDRLPGNLDPFGNPPSVWYGLARLQRTSLAERLSQFLSARADPRASLLALTNPDLAPEQVEQAWSVMSRDWSTTFRLLPHLSEFIPRHNAHDAYLTSEPLDVGLTEAPLAYWIHLGWGSDALHAQWIDELFGRLRHHAYFSNEWPTLTPENLERLHHEIRHALRTKRLKGYMGQVIILFVRVLLNHPLTPPDMLRDYTGLVLSKPEWLKRLSNAEDRLLVALARHPNTPEDIMKDLKRKRKLVPHLFQNPSFPERLGKTLTHNAVAYPPGKPRTPTWFANRVLSSPRGAFAPTVHAEAWLHPNVDPSLPKPVEKLPEPVRHQLALRASDLTETNSRVLTKDPRREVRAALATLTPYTSIQKALQHDPCDEVRAALPQNPNLHITILAHLARHDPGAHQRLEARLPHPD